MGKPQVPARAAGQRGARPSRARCASRPQKLNLVAALIRGKKVDVGARRPRLLAQAHRRRRQEDAGERHRQRREQPRPRRRRAGRRRSLCRQVDRDEALPCPRPRPRRPHREAVLEPDDRRSRSRSRRPEEDRWVRKSIRSVFASASTGPGIRAGSPTRASTASCCTRTSRSASPDEAAQAGRRLEDRHRASAQEVPRHHPLGAPGHGHRQEGRRHRQAAQEAVAR